MSVPIPVKDSFLNSECTESQFGSTCLPALIQKAWCGLNRRLLCSFQYRQKVAAVPGIRSEGL
jgi:hypothetical protein